MNNKRGIISLSNPKTVMYGIITAIVAVTLISSVIGTLINATVDISNVANMPLSGLFAAGGAVVLLLGAAVVFAFIKVFGGGKS